VSRLRVLALDVGTSSVRASVFDETAEERDEPARREYPGEYDPDVVLARTREAIEEAGGAAGVDAVGTSCFGHSLLPLDRHGRPLTQILSWRDTRSADAADRLMQRVDADAVHLRTGCHIHTSYWPAKLAWLAEEEPEVFRSAHRFVSFCDYLYAQLLGGEVPASISMASPTGLVDLGTRTWDEELLDTLGVDAQRLPEISDAPVDGWYPALLDGACSNFGAGCVTRERAALMVGTSGAIRVVYESTTPEPPKGSSSTGSTQRVSSRAARCPTAAISMPGWSRRSKTTTGGHSQIAIRIRTGSRSCRCSAASAVRAGTSMRREPLKG
jgi:gluconokinase